VSACTERRDSLKSRRENVSRGRVSKLIEGIWALTTALKGTRSLKTLYMKRDGSCATEILASLEQWMLCEAVYVDLSDRSTHKRLEIYKLTVSFENYTK
jgi:hypothetical protein